MIKGVRNSMVLLFFVVVIAYSKLICAAHMAHIFEPRSIYNNTASTKSDNANIEIIAVGISELDGESYEINFLLKNRYNDGCDIRLTGNYIFSMTDGDGVEHDFKITDVKYSDRCANGAFSKECVIRASVKNIVSSINKFKSYRIVIPYIRSGSDGEMVQAFENDMSDIICQDLGDISSVLGSYSINIENISEYYISIGDIFFESKCIVLEREFTTMYLPSGAVQEIKFVGNANKNSGCKGYIGINYTNDKDKNNKKTLLIPIEIVYHKNGVIQTITKYPMFLAFISAAIGAGMGGVVHYFLHKPPHNISNFHLDSNDDDEDDDDQKKFSRRNKYLKFDNKHERLEWFKPKIGCGKKSSYL